MTLVGTYASSFTGSLLRLFRMYLLHASDRADTKVLALALTVATATDVTFNVGDVVV
jgi:hypothetical protein